MVPFLKNYRALAFGLSIVVVLRIVLVHFKLILIDPKEAIENVLGFLFWWLTISFAIHKIPYLRKKRVVAYKILALLVILVLAIWADTTQQIPDNPITLPLVILFWVGLGSLLLPIFFKKYRIPIVSGYTLLIGYFLYVRLSPGYFEKYDDTIIILIVASILLLLALWLFEQWKWLKTLKTEKANAELDLLKSQINPHFFFNTLNNLYGLVIEKSDKAPEVVLKLSDMMRYTIYEGKKEVVPLREEIIYLENYIELHQLRYRKTVDISFEYSIDADYGIAPLLFIILLENAFKHGVESLTANAFIHIRLEAANNKIVFEVENNFGPPKIESRKGIGLENLKRRLKLIYPNKYILDMARMEKVYRTVLQIELK